MSFLVTPKNRIVNGVYKEAGMNFSLTSEA
jgi:hypothetical protein